MDFLERKIPMLGGNLQTYSAGKGPRLVFLHGGPGDTHDYLKRLAEPLLSEFQCILYDQRGNGGSSLEELSFETLAIERHIEDVQRVADSYGIERTTLVGHSWGAMLALATAAAIPDRIERLVLLDMGPLDEEMAQVTGANLMHVLAPEERNLWHKLRRERKEAMESGKEDLRLELEAQLMELRVKAWIYKPELRPSFLQDYFSEPAVNRAVNEVVSRDMQRFFRWQMLDKVKARIFIGQGQQDYVPLQQAYRVRERCGRVEIRVWNECGHMPWYDQPELFYWDLRSFLGSV